jgi:dipeptide/tripeptide permease
LVIRREDQLHSPDEGPELSADQPQHKSPLRVFTELVREPAFFRLLVLIALVLGVRAVYTYFYLLMPKYWERTIGTDAAIGKLNMINPIGIVIGLILFIPFANKFKVFNMLIFGAMISALSIFPLALPWQWYSSDISRAHYEMAILCMIIVTIGEVFWSPKLNEYTAAIAPKGQEGTYLGFSMLPWFAAKLIVSKLSGHMLTRWSPENVLVGNARMPLRQAMLEGRVDYWHSPAAMWFWLGVWALTGCIIAALLRGWLTSGAQWKKAETPATE